MTLGRLGVACQWLTPDGRKHPEWQFRGLNRQNYRRFGAARLHAVALHNARTLYDVVAALARAPRHRRMFRIGNHVLPCLTLPEARPAWQDRGFVRDLERAWEVVGKIAREGDVRLSTHPSQFIIPNSESAHVRQTSTEDLDKWAHYASILQNPDFCMNVHLAPRFDGRVRTVVASWHRARRDMSRDAWRILTVENDDKLWSAAHLLTVAREVGFRPVVDVHHHWVVTGLWPDAMALGEAVVPLWPRGRPKIHVSLPRGRYFTPRGLDEHGLPRLDGGMSREFADESIDRYNPVAHADMPWAPGTARYVRELLRWSDAMIELKAKNLAVRRLSDDIKALS